MKSVEVRLNETMALLTKYNLIEKFDGIVTNKQQCPIEVQLNTALSLLKGEGIIESIIESDPKDRGVYTVFQEVLAEVDAAGKRQQFDERAKNLTSVEAKINCAKFVLGVKPVSESRRHIPKKNGATVNESQITEAERKVVSKKEKLVESVMATCNLTEASAREFLGLKRKDPEGLTHRQATEYHIARKCGMSESDSLVLAKMPLKEAFSPLPR
jgi:hypothetical protein